MFHILKMEATVLVYIQILYCTDWGYWEIYKYGLYYHHLEL